MENHSIILKRHHKFPLYKQGVLKYVLIILNETQKTSYKTTSDTLSNASESITKEQYDKLVERFH